MLSLNLGLHRRVLFAVVVAWAAAGTAATTNLNHFGFSGPEIFPIDSQISQLHAADLDGDGLIDLVVVNNMRSKLNLLYNQTGKTNRPGDARLSRKRELNELPPDARFRIDSIASESRISSLAVTDLNGDGRPDLAYFGEPKELVVLYNQGTNGWSAPKRWPMDDGQLTPNALSTGDLNGDGRPDLILLGDNCVHFFPQKADHTLGEPERPPFSGTVRSAQIIDVDGDGREDLLLVNWEDRSPFRFRLQKSNGERGPEMFFSCPPIRSYTADNLEGTARCSSSPSPRIPGVRRYPNLCASRRSRSRAASCRGSSRSGRSSMSRSPAADCCGRT